MKKETFVLDIVEELRQNPRPVFASHKLNPAVMNLVSDRPDVLAKLASILWVLKLAKKGANGLKASPGFKILGYKTFGNLIDSSREDIETFISGLPTEEQNTFSNADNVIGLMVAKDVANTGEEDLETLIISGKTVALPFEKLVQKGFAMPGSMYILVLISDKLLRPVEEKIAIRKEKINKKKEAKRIPGKIKAELKAKAEKRLNALKKKRSELESTLYSTTKELEQFKQIGKEFNVETGKPSEVFNAMNVAKTVGVNTGKIIEAKRQALKDRIKYLTSRSEELLVRLSTEKDQNKILSIKSMISKNSTEIRDARARLGTYKNMSPKAIRNKAQILKDVSKSIENNILEGMSIGDSLNKALSELIAKPAEKQIIKQEVMQQVANGVPTAFAVQQALQSNVKASDDSSILNKKKTIEEIIAML